MCTVVVCGGSTMSLLTWLDIPLGVEDEEEDSSRTPLSGTASPNHNYSSMSRDAPIPPGSTPADKSVAAKAWSGFDTMYMKPLLTHSNPTLMETLPTWCASVARLLTTTEQLAHHPGFHAGENNDADDKALSSNIKVKN